MAYSFDEIVPRKGTDCVKIDIFNRDELTYMWVADMDFKTPDFVINAIQNRLNQGILGYTVVPQRWYDAIIAWQKNLYDWDIKKEELTFIPGIVRGIGFAEQAFTQKGDKVMVMPPIYHPFFLVTKKLGREVVYCPLEMKEGRYFIDFERFEKDIKGCKMLVLSNPHNPGGRVWSVDELQKIAEIAADNNCIVISDEIHADMTFPGFKHHPMPTVSEKAKNNTIFFGAPTKVFNMPGVISSYAIVPNKDLREKFFAYLNSCELESGNLFSYDACAACYEKGNEWRQQMLSYISGNLDYIEEFLSKNVPGIKMLRPEASFLAWLDCRELGLSQDELVELFVEKAHLYLNNGAMFGEQGKGFMRLNVATQRVVIEKAMSQLAEAVASLKK